MSPFRRRIRPPPSSYHFALPKAMSALFVRCRAALCCMHIRCLFPSLLSPLSSLLSPLSLSLSLSLSISLSTNRLPLPCYGSCLPAFLVSACLPARLLVSVCWSAHWLVTWLPTRYSDGMFEKHTALARPKLVLRLITLSCIRHRHQKAPRFRRFPI